MKKLERLAIGLCILGWIGTAQAAATDQEKCAAAKLAAAGKYTACRTGADKKAALNGTTADYSKCDEKQAASWTKIEEKYGPTCPTSGDQAAVKAAVSSLTQCLAGKLDPAGAAQAIQVECVPCPAGGAVVDGTCWLLGAAGDSCNATCALADMAYDGKTDTYASTTAGSVGHCMFILEKLGHGFTGSGNFLGGPSDQGLGCAYERRAVLTGTATAQGSYTAYQRVCACH